MSKSCVMSCFAIAGSLFCFSALTQAQTDFWQQTNGPFGLTPERQVLAITSDSLSRMYLATFNPTKIYVSTNEGEQWSEATSIGTEAYALATNLQGDVFAATFQGVFRSTDFGESWTQHTTGLTTTELDHIVALPNGDLLVGTWHGGIFRSTDEGEHWSQSGLSSASHIEGIFPGRGGLVFATISTMSDSNLYRSTDYGITWTPWPTPPYGGFTFAFDSFGRMYASAIHGPAWMSSNGGASWDSIGIGLPGYVYDSMIHVSSSDDVFLVISGRGVYRTTNMGQTWARVERRLARGGGWGGMTWTPSKNLAIAANILGVLRSDNSGTSWSMRNKGLGFTSVPALAADSTGLVYAGTGIGVLMSSDQGENWLQPDTGDAPIAGNGFILDSLGNVIVAAPRGFFRSTNRGVTWSSYQTNATAYSVAETRLHTLVATDWYSSISSQTQYARIYRSTDGGISWSQRFEGASSSPIRGIGQIGSVVYAGCLKSTDDGLTWQGQSRGASFCVSGVVQNRLGRYLVAVRDSIYETPDLGTTWSPLTSFGLGINCMAIDSVGALYIGTNGKGVFASTDHGTTWQQRSTGLADSVIHSIVFSSDHHLWCGTATQGVYRSTQTVTNVLADFDQHPIKLLLQQNYPNPFNPTTTIQFTLTRSSMVTLKVFDMLGRLVATLISRRYESGTHSVAWDAGDRSSGVYFYRLEAGDVVTVRRMLVLR